MDPDIGKGLPDWGTADVGMSCHPNCVTKAIPCWRKVGVGPIHLCKFNSGGSFVWILNLTPDFLIFEARHIHMSKKDHFRS